MLRVFPRTSTRTMTVGRMPGKRTLKAEDFFREALQTQSAVINQFPDLPSHNRVLLEFVRLRLAQVHRERSRDAQNLNEAGRCRDLLETCIENLAELTSKPDLAQERLAWSSQVVAYDALSHVLAEIGENEGAEEARRNGEAVRNKRLDRRRYY